MGSRKELIDKLEDYADENGKPRRLRQRWTNARPTRLTPLLLACIALLIDATTATENTVLRQNFGTVMSKFGTVDTTQSQWNIVFEYDIPDLQDLKVDNLTSTCSNSSIPANDCLLYNDLVQQLANLRRTSLEDIKRSISALEHLIPSGSPTRSKRALFGFLGSWLHDITGVMDQDQAKILDSDISTLKKQQISTARRISSLSSKFISLVKDNQQLASNITGILKHFGSEIRDTVRRQKGYMFHVHNSLIVLGRLAREIVHTTAGVNHVSRITQQWVTGAHTLLNGRLPPEFVSHQQLSDALDHVSSKLRTLGNYEIAHKDIKWYYHVNNVAFKRSNGQILITVSVPLHSHGTYTVYRVHVLPVPVNHTSRQATMVQNLPAYFAVATDMNSFIEIPHADLTNCRGTQALRCPTLPAANDKSVPSCAYALYTENRMNIDKFCDIGFELSLARQSAINLGFGSYLLTGPPKPTFSVCHGEAPISYTPCSLCVIKPKCNCLIRSADFFIPPSLTNCAQTHEQVHGVNLAFLSKFAHHAPDLDSLTASSSFPTPKSFPADAVHVVNMSIDKVVETSKQFSLSLNRIKSNEQQDNENYADSATYLLNSLAPVSGLTSSYHFQLMVLAYMITSAIAILYLLWRSLNTACVRQTVQVPLAVPSPVGAPVPVPSPNAGTAAMAPAPSFQLF